MEDIEIQVWESKEVKERAEELLPGWYNFWKNEPLNSAAVGCIEDGDTKQNLADLLCNSDRFTNSGAPAIIAWDPQNKKVAGFVLSYADYSEKALESLSETPDISLNFGKYPFSSETLEKLDAIGEFLGDAAGKADVFNKYSVDKAWFIDVTSVLPDYTRRGLANRMTARALEVAKERGFEIATATSSSSYTRRNKINTHQFEIVLERSFAEHYRLYSDIPEKIKKGHDKAAVLVKRLE